MRHPSTFQAALLTALALAGCAPPDSGSSSLVEVPASVELGLQGSSSKITGTRIRHNLTAQSPQTNTRDDFAGWDLSAQEQTCTSPRSFAATFPSLGNFTIAGVPHRRYFLRASNDSLGFPRYFDTHERELDLGEYFLGRANAIPAATGTVLAVSLSGLAPYTPGDDFQLTSAGAGLGFGSFLSVASAQPADGATAFAADVAYADLTSFGNGGLIDSAQGDVAFFTQLISNPVQGDVLYSSSLARSAKVTSLSMLGGATTPVAAALQGVAQTGHLTRTLRRTAFDAIKSQINPAAQPVAYDLGVDVAPAGLQNGSISGTPDLAYMGLAAGPSDASIVFNYGNPFPPSWPAFGFHLATYEVDLSVVTPSGTLTYAAFVRSIINEALPAFGANGIAPGIAPVRHALIDGAPFFSSAKPSSLTPSVSWDAPAFGHASFYVLTVTELTIDAGAVTGRKIASVTTREREVKVPAGVLSAGGRYTFTLTAVASPGTRPDERPFQRRYPMYSTDAISGVISP
jgi:hypothetical protein